MTGWATLARESAELLGDQVSEFRAAGADREKLNPLSARPADVRVHHIDSPHPFAWLTGIVINESWRELHRIEERMDQLTPDAYIDDLVGVAERHAAQRMPGKRAAELKHELTESAIVAAQKQAAVAVIHEAHGGGEKSPGPVQQPDEGTGRRSHG